MLSSVRPEGPAKTADQPVLVSLTRRLDIRTAASGALERLKSAAAQRPCIVLLGESNSGKTTIANRLVGNAVLPTSVIANTRYPTLLRHASAIKVQAVTSSARRVMVDDELGAGGEAIALLDVELPGAQLRNYNILDTPSRFVPNNFAELPGIGPQRIPVWCTTATQAWKESERKTWLALDNWHRRHGILVVTRIDHIADAEHRRKLSARLQTEAGPYFQRIICSPSQSEEELSVAAILGNLANKLHERRQRTIARLTARIIELANDAVTTEASSNLAVLGFKKAKQS